MSSHTRLARRMKRVRDAADAMREAARQIAAALVPRPSRRDAALLGAMVERVPALAADLAFAASWMRSSRPDPDSAEAHRVLGLQVRATAEAVPAVVAALGEVLAGRSEPLYARQRPRTTAERRVELLGTAFTRFERAATAQDQSDAMRDAHFGFIPFAADEFVAQLQSAWRLLSVLDRIEGASLLDVGAGIGSKLFIADAFFDRVAGIELDPGYLARAEAICNPVLGHGTVFAADAMLFEDYGAYDVIYFYSPFRQAEGQSALEERIWEQARDGAVIIAPRVFATFIHRLPHVALNMTVKGFDRAGLEELAAEAERVGPAVPPARGGRGWKRSNLLLPAVQALWRAGFAL